jgi:type IV pilus assembly protein PilX
MRQQKQQQGVVLIVSLILLVLVTLISVSSMKNTVLEEKMAGNYKDKNSAFQAAEAALREGESYIANTVTLPFFDGNTTGLYPPTLTGAARWDSVNWDSSSGEVINYSGNLPNVASPPMYIIEELPTVPTPGSSLEASVADENKYFRITTKAVGDTENSAVTLQSTYKR